MLIEIYRKNFTPYTGRPGGVATMPELAGCTAEGSTAGEAIANLEIAAQAWIANAKAKGKPIPVPEGGPAAVIQSRNVNAHIKVG